MDRAWAGAGAVVESGERNAVTFYFGLVGSLGRGRICSLRDGWRLTQDSGTEVFARAGSDGDFRSVPGAQKRVERRAANDADFRDAAFESAASGFEFENHAAGNDTGLNEAFDLFTSDGGENFVAIEHARNIGEIDQTVGTQKFGAGGGHVVGVDVVQLVVGSDAEARSDREQVRTPEGFEKVSVQAGEIADETETAFDFIMNHRFGKEASGVGCADTDSGTAFGRDRGGEAFVEQAGKNHHTDVASFAIGDAESGDEITFDAHALESGGEEASASVDHEDLVTFAGEDGDLTRDVAHGGSVFEQGSGKFDDSSHVSAVCSLIRNM